VGVINVTPDSFFGASRYPDPTRAVAAALDMARAGAQIIDIGGESSRPGAARVPVEEELDRVLPVISELRGKISDGVLLSVDTRKSKVAEKALGGGADIVNDVSGLAGLAGLASDPGMAELAADSGAGLVLMHMKGTPRTMQRHPSYFDVVHEVREWLEQAIRQAETAGVAPESIVVDPGIGFGKSAEHNLQILNRLSDLATLDKPVLVGTSRKSFIGRVLGTGPEERLYGTAATLAASILGGAHLVRVHDVAEMSQVAQVADAILNEKVGP
jgi:dihydropteroate synthase